MEENLEIIHDNSKIMKIEDFEIQIIQKLYFFFSQYKNIEYEYKESLLTILLLLNNNKQKENSIFNDYFDKLKNYINEKCEYHKFIYNSLNQNICPLLGEFIEKESLHFDDIKNENTKSQMDYKYYKNNLETLEDQYNFEGLNSISKISNEIEESKKEIDKKLDKILDKYKKEYLGKKIEKYRNDYLKGINEYNQSVENYIIKSNNTYKEFCKIREKYVKNFFYVLKEFINIENNKKDILTSSLNEIESLINNFEIEKHLINFIKENTEINPKPKKADFNSFASTCEGKDEFKTLKLQFNNNPIIITKIKDLINQEFKYFSPQLYHYDENKKKKFSQLHNYIENLSNGKLTSDNIDEIKILFNENEEYIDYLILQLNKLRSQLKILNTVQYNSVKNILIYILDLYEEKNKDYHNMALLILLSQTFFKQENRVLMEEDIKYHSSLKKEKIWINIIEMQINKELISNDDDEDIKLGQNQIDLKLFSILTAFKMNLPSFGFSNEEIENIFKPFKEKYKNSNVWNYLADLDLNKSDHLKDVNKNENQKKEEKKEEEKEEKKEEEKEEKKIQNIDKKIDEEKE